ncbi:MAG: hydrogenase maturation protease [Ignavibacteriae bacterium]|nr:MAG: hydrogenase maturation protease [Ignavibacteriota bacterium]
MAAHPKISVIALGNDKMGDDAAALIAARDLQKKYGSQITVLEIPVAGFGLFDKIKDYDKVLILDSISTNHNKPGTIIKLHKSDITKILSWSPHYVGMPEIFKFAEQMQIRFPEDLQILAVKIEDPYRIGEGMSESVKSKLPEMVNKASQIVDEWLEEQE